LNLEKYNTTLFSIEIVSKSNLVAKIV
jgi:hypothetical protein